MKNVEKMLKKGELIFMQEIICKDEYQTKIFANNLAGMLKKGDVLVLSGELGAGKTKFVEGILSHF